MTTKTKIKRQRPESKLKDVLAGKDARKGVIDKQFTAMKAAGEDGDGEFGAIFTPTDEELVAINAFTRRPVTEDEVVCFSTMSCNDMIDRDLDRFTAECVEDFAKLEGALSPVGKSFMVSHDYSKLPVGRIFDVGTKDVEGTKFLTNKVYMPKTESNQSYIENLEFGIYWAVSVGVMLEESACTVCQSPMVGNWFTFCIENGHEKGLWYDPDSDETDSWGWAEPVAEGTKGAVLCTRDLFSPKDFYELSQCFLGAQYDAELSKGAMKGIIKAASKAKIPILNLSREEAKLVPFEHVSKEVREAHIAGYEVTAEDDGTVSWTDAHDLVWVFDPSESEVQCLGTKSKDDDEDTEEVESDGEGNEGTDDDEDAPGADDALGVEAGDGQSDQADGEGEPDAADADAEGEGLDTNTPDDDADDDEDDSESDDADDVSAADEDEEDDEDDDDEDDADEAKSVTDAKKATLAAAKKAGFPAEVVKAFQKAKGDGLDALLVVSADHIRSLAEKVSSLEPKAELGDSFLAAKRAEAIAWYVKAHQVGKDEAVSVVKFTKTLDRLGSDIELIDEAIEQQKDLAKAKFPASVRRSTAEKDHNTVEEAPAPLPISDKGTEKVRRAHG